MQNNGFWVCLNPCHPAVLEVLAAEDVEKYQETEGGYVKLRFSATKGGALDMVREILEHCYQVDAEGCQGDPTGKFLKQMILKLYP